MDLKNLAAKAAKVAELAKAREEAFASERAAEEELLASVVDVITPALKALASKIERAFGIEDCGPVSLYLSDESGPIRGFLVCSEDFRPGPDGFYRDRLLLGENGGWIRCFDSAEHDPKFGWDAEITWGFSVTRRWKIDQIIQGIVAALDRQLDGDGAKRTEAALRRSEQLHALATLVRPPVKAKQGFSRGLPRPR